MFRIPYLLIKNRLESIPEIKIIDIDLGQDTKQFKGGVKGTPMVLINFRPINPQALGKNEQQGIMEFEVKLITSVTHSSDKRLSENTPLNHFELLDKIHHHLQKWAGNTKQLVGGNDMKVMGSANRTYIDYQNTHDSLMRSLMRYQCTVKDIGKQINYVPANPNLDVQ